MQARASTQYPLRSRTWHWINNNTWNSLRLRYNLQGADLPSHCACRDLFTVSHALSCKTRSFVAQRLDGIRNLLTSLLSKVCKNVEVEPHRLPIDNKVFNLISTVTSPEARLDIKAEVSGHEEKRHFSTYVLRMWTPRVTRTNPQN